MYFLLSVRFRSSWNSKIILQLLPFFYGKIFYYLIRLIRRQISTIFIWKKKKLNFFLNLNKSLNFSFNGLSQVTALKYRSKQIAFNKSFYCNNSFSKSVFRTNHSSIWVFLLKNYLFFSLTFIRFNFFMNSLCFFGRTKFFYIFKSKLIWTSGYNDAFFLNAKFI